MTTVLPSLSGGGLGRRGSPQGAHDERNHMSNMTKKDLIAAIREHDDSQSVASLRKMSQEELLDIYMELNSETKVAAKPFRERPEIKPLLEEFRIHRSKEFTPAVYRNDDARLVSALQLLKGDILAIAEAAGVEL